MAKRSPKNKIPKQIESITHDEAKRKNIPTAEYQSVMRKEDQDPIRLAYERRNRDLDPQLVWRGKDEQDWSDLVVQAPPLYIQEKIHPKVLIDDLKRQTEKQAAEESGHQFDLFSDFNGLPNTNAKTEFYQHDQNWSNRMILGDSLQVMASLAEREGLRGKVQCIYIDPPYGIKFNSNFQWSTTSRDVKDGNTEHITREPEQVKAFRDTWRDGIHSYLTYLRDRLTVARDLLTESGSIFVQIGDENVHRVRALMDEVFGDDNFLRLIAYRTKSPLGAGMVPATCDFLLWYGKNREVMKFRRSYIEQSVAEDTHMNHCLLQDGSWRAMSQSEKYDTALLPSGALPFRFSTMSSSGFTPSCTFPFEFEDNSYRLAARKSWRTNIEGMTRLAKTRRLVPTNTYLNYVQLFDDFPYIEINNVWTDTHAEQGKSYVVQTSTRVVTRCLLMTTDPGDLVLDPTCGSGTAAYVAEQWGRRWITIDTSRVALALARARIMGARYPYYLLADSKDGQLKEAELTRTAPSEKPTYGNIRQGFVYERVPHITLKSIAHNTEIDVIWEKFQAQLEPLRKEMNSVLKKSWEEWEIPRDAEKTWSKEAIAAHAKWWELRIARQQEIDASIAAKAEYEYLYDKPYEGKNTVRVAGPFTVESLSPHRVLGVDEDDELIDTLQETPGAYGKPQTFNDMILENLRMAGVQQAHKEDKINFISLNPWPGHHICAEGRFEGSDEWLVAGGKEVASGVGLVASDQEEKGQVAKHKSQTTRLLRAGILVGPEFGTLCRLNLVEAAREAGDANFDVLITCAFNYDAQSCEFDKLGRVPVLKARMNADLHMAADLKNTGKGNLFVIFGEPDVEVVCGQWLVAKNGRRIAHYESCKKLSGLGSLEEINRLGGTDLPRLKVLSGGGALRTDQPDTQSSGDQSHVRRTQKVAAIQALTPADFPLSLTTDHLAQVTINGVDVFKPQTGKVESSSPDDIACWFIDTDYNRESFFVRHAYFLGQNDPYKSLKTTLKAEINEEAWESLHSATSRPFEKPKSGRIAVKVINHLGDEVMKVFKV